jgi:tetratricopeptide (TPR) repeat protein
VRNLPSEEQAPAFDTESELPLFFTGRRIQVLQQFGVRPEVAPLVLKASAQLARGDLKRARPSLEEVTRLQPTLNAAHFVLAGLYDISGEHDAAIARYRIILTTAPDEVRSLNNLAYTLAVSRNAPAEALPLAEKAYRIANDKDALADLDLGASLIAGQGTPVGALPFNLDAYDIFAMKAQIADTVGWAYHLLGRNAEAQKFLEEAGKGAPLSGEVQFHIAAAEAAAGHAKQALDALNRALVLDSTLADREDVKKLRQDLQQR